MPLSRLKRSTLAGLVAMALLAAGCSSSSKPASSPGPPGSTLSNTHTLTIDTSFAITSLDPIKNGHWAPSYGYGEMLMRPEYGGALQPWLLSSVTQTSPDVWTMRLRPNLRFQDGAPLDAAALAQTMNYSLANNSEVQPDLPGAKVTASGPLIDTLTTTSPLAAVPSLMGNAAMFPIFDVTRYLTLKATPSALEGAGIYTGPYVVKSLTPTQMVLGPSPDYWGARPPLTSMTVNFVSDDQARILAVEHGEADIALYPPSAAQRELAARTDAYFLTQRPGTGYGGFRMVLNLRAAPFNDAAVRQAVLHGIDYASIANQVLGGQSDVATGVYPAYLPYALRDQTTDVGQAEHLLDQDGWKPGSDGIRTKDGQRLQFTLLIYPQQPDGTPVALAMQAELKSIGVDMQIRSVPDINTALEQPTGWQAGFDSVSFLDQTGTDPVQPLVDDFTPTGDSNYGGVNDPELTQIIGQLRGLTNAAQRTKLLEQAQRIIIEQRAYSIFVDLKRSPVVVSPALRAYPVPPALLWVQPFA